MITWRRLGSGLAAIAVCWVILFWRLGHVGLIDDGAHYARLTREMAAHGDWMVPRLDGVALIDKPVFFHWVQGVTTTLVADDELAARLPSALAAVALFGLMAWFGAASAGRQAGRGAWLMLATVPATFLLGRTGFMDMLFSALLFGAVALITRTLSGSSPWAQAGAVVCLALAILTKGPIAAVLVGAWLGALFLLDREARRALAGIRVWACVAGGCVLASPWFLWMYSQYSDQFVGHYFGRGHLDYLSPRGSASSSQWTFYVRMFMTSFFPWSLITIGYGVDTYRRWRRGAAVPLWESALWLWMAIVLISFTLVPFRVDRYIYPAAPACCLLAARGWLSASAEPRWREFAATRAAIAIVALMFVAAGVFVWSSLPRLGVTLPNAVAVLPGVMVVGGLAIVAAIMRRGVGLPRLTAWPIITLVTVYASLVFIGLPIIRTGLPVEQIGRFVADRTADGAPVGVLGLDRLEGGLAYYLHHPPHHLQNVAEAERFAKAPGPRWMIVREESRKLAAPGGCVTFSIPAIVGTKGRGIRTQVWGDILVIRYDAAATTNYANSACPLP